MRIVSEVTEGEQSRLERFELLEQFERFTRAMSNIVDFIEGMPLKLLNPEAVPD